MSPGGSFTLSDLEPGGYILQVLDAQGNEIVTDHITVAPSGNPPVSIRLPDRPVSRPTGQTIPAARLLHPPDKRAVQAAAKAERLAETREYERAAAELERAVQYDPNYADAFNNLGAQYMRLRRPAEAEAAFRRAITLDPGGSLQQANLAVALAQTGRLEEAETRARGAVRLDPASERARGILDAIAAARKQLRGAGRTNTVQSCVRDCGRQ